MDVWEPTEQRRERKASATDLGNANLLPLGRPEPKKWADILEVVAVVASLICFFLACVAVSSWTTVPFRLGLTRQLQVVGLLLSVMNQCFLMVMPKFFLILEARFGGSLLQNYDAILRRSSFVSHTHVLWRSVLMASTLLPIGLSIAYKEFQQGTSSRSGNSSLIDKTQNNFYGLTGPAQYDIGKTQTIGTSLMTNATLPFSLATQEDPPIPPMPQAYGFNTLMLSDTSIAALDAPMPDYVSSLQSALGLDESLDLTANVNATITTYNASIEDNRNNSNFWGYYASLSNTTQLTSSNVQLSNMYTDETFAILINDLGVFDSSFCFMGFVPSNNSNNFTNFQKGALLFDTKRAACTGQWRITPVSVELISGSCDQPPLPASSQNIFTHASLALSQFFMPSLVEYLQTFSQGRSQSPWLIPTFSTAIVNMYWARITVLHGHTGWGVNQTIFVDPNPNATQRSDIYYRVPDDQIVWRRPSMNPSWALYFIFVVQPVLIILILFADVLMYTTPIGRGFGLISMLAGIRTDGLHLLEGASFSGRLRKPLRVRIGIKAKEVEGDKCPEMEYLLADEGKNASFSRPQVRLPTSLSSVGRKRRRRKSAGDAADSSVSIPLRHDMQHEMR